MRLIKPKTNKPILDCFPPAMHPRPGQVPALTQMDESFKSGKRFFVLEGPTGFGKSPVAKTFLNAYESGVITTPLNQLVGQYTGDEKLAPPPLSEVCGKSNYQCSAFNRLTTTQRARKQRTPLGGGLTLIVAWITLPTGIDSGGRHGES